MRDYDRNYDTMTREYDRDRIDRDRGAFFGSNDERSRFEDRSRERERGWFGSREDERGFESDRRPGLPRNETGRLIASDKVEGTPVYGRDREQLGSIHNFMVEKRSGKAQYAVMKTSSGFLGLDERYFPLEWNELTYDTRVDGYHVDMSKEELERRRSFDSRGRPTGIDRDRRDMGEMRSYGRDYEDRGRWTW